MLDTLNNLILKEEKHIKEKIKIHGCDVMNIFINKLFINTYQNQM